MRWALVASGLLLSASLGACAVGGGDNSDANPAHGGSPSPELGQPASRLPSGAPEGSPTSTTIDSASATQPSGPTSTTVGGTTPAERPNERIVLVLDDPGGDAGLGAPAHGDLRRITVTDDGTHARITIEVGGVVPSHLAVGETAGIGFDIFHSASLESDHQLFIDGGDAGWTAYLQTPDGFVAFPGTFGIGGHSLELRVPWSSIGGRVSSRVSAFADTSRSATPVNQAWTDAAPDRGTSDLRP